MVITPNELLSIRVSIIVSNSAIKVKEVPVKAYHSIEKKHIISIDAAVYTIISSN